MANRRKAQCEGGKPEKSGFFKKVIFKAQTKYQENLISISISLDLQFVILLLSIMIFLHIFVFCVMCVAFTAIGVSTDKQKGDMNASSKRTGEDFIQEVSQRVV